MNKNDNSKGRDVQVHFTTDLGAQVTVSTTHDKVLECQRFFGSQGWFSGDIPPGGFMLPYENEGDFDWSLLGGRTFVNRDGEVSVVCRGHVWKRRELEAVTSKKMTLPAAVKYSRGAKPTDPVDIREKTDGDIEYVTLVVFRGGRRNENYALPQKLTLERAG